MSTKASTRSLDDRKFPRRAFKGRVEVQEHIHGRVVSATASDINPMGMRIHSRKSFRPGDLITLRFPAPGSAYDLSINGEVVRADDDGVGVEFFGLEDWIFDELCDYVYATDASQSTASQSTDNNKPDARRLVLTLESSSDADPDWG